LSRLLPAQFFGSQVNSAVEASLACPVFRITSKLGSWGSPAHTSPRFATDLWAETLPAHTSPRFATDLWAETLLAHTSHRFATDLWAETPPAHTNLPPLQQPALTDPKRKSVFSLVFGHGSSG